MLCITYDYPIVSVKRGLRVRKECPICRQTVKGLVKIFLNLDPTMSQRPVTQTPRMPTIIATEAPVPSSPLQLNLGTPRRVNPRRQARPDPAVINLASEDDEQRIVFSDGDSTTIEGDSEPDELDEDDDEEYPDLERMEYSDIEPDLNQFDQLQDQLARAMLRIEALIQSNMNLTRAAATATGMINALQTQAQMHQREAEKALAKAESQERAHQKTKQKLSIAEKQIEQLSAGLCMAKAEIDSLMMRKIASDIERILADLTSDQAVAFGSDIAGMSMEEICLRMAGLVLVSKEDRAQLVEMEQKARVRTLECEQLTRKVKKLEEELQNLREEKRLLEEALDENFQRAEPINVAPPKPKTESFTKDPFRPAPLTKPPLSSISAPSKFKTAIKRSFEVPDGIGGTTKKPFFPCHK